jgi:DNA-binding PadR family transcriptional regulator
MVEVSNAEAALLGLLNEQPMYPYQIEQEVKYRDMRFWTELSMSTIYKLLEKLEKVALVLRTNEVSSKNRLRKLYAISDEGKRRLKEKIKALLSSPEHIRWQIDIGTYNSNLLTTKEVQAAMLTYRKSLEKQIHEYEELLKFLQSEECTPYRFGVATRPIFLLKGEIQWVDSHLDQLRQETT